MIRILIIAVISASLLSACGGRHLTINETAFISKHHHPRLNLNKVKVAESIEDGVDELMKSAEFKAQAKAFKSTHQGVSLTKADILKAYRKHSAGRKKGLSGMKGGSADAITFFNTIYFDNGYYSDDILEGYPDFIFINDAALLAHEVTHVWQYQNRDITGYHPVKALFEHIQYSDPYSYTLTPGKKFLDYRYEQQGRIVQDYILIYYVNSSDPRVATYEKLIKESIPLKSLKLYVDKMTKQRL
jgi:hypothetical protein